MAPPDSERCEYIYPPTTLGQGRQSPEGRRCQGDAEGDRSFCEQHRGECRECGKEVMKDATDDSDEVICWSCWKEGPGKRFVAQGDQA